MQQSISMTPAKPIVLVFVSSYIPGHKAGGPVRSIVNLVETLGDEFEFKILTSDRDLGDTEPFPEVVRDEWVQVGKARVMYLSPRAKSVGRMIRLLQTVDYDIIYLNSFFARRWSMQLIVLRRLGLTRKVPVVLAPRGEFSKGAINIKSVRKRMYMTAVSLLGLYRHVIWQASTTYEEVDIKREIADVGAVVCTAMDLASPVSGPIACAEHVKESGLLRAVFLSRISRMKNLDMALELLKGLSGHVYFDIYGPAEDSEYWAKCQAIITELPENVHVQYRGHVPHDQVAHVFANYDLFVLPTLGENFGHVISESLTAGCPVLISDQTPWRDLYTKGVGWDIPLDQPDKLREALQKCVDMGPEEHLAMRHKARTFAIERSTDPVSIEQNRMLFLRAVGMDIRMSDNKVVN